MSNTISYQIVRSKDEVYFNSLKKLAEHQAAKPLSSLEIELFGGTTVNCDLTSQDPNQELRDILSIGGQVFQRTTLKSPNGHVYVEIRRPLVDASRGEAIFDTVTISRGQQQGSMLDGVHFATLLAHVQQQLHPVSSTNLGPLLGPGVDKHFAAREEALNRLEQFVDKVFREMESTRKSREVDYQKREEELESKCTKKQEDLQAEFQAKNAQLQEERDSLAKLKAEFDDRSSTHARRDIRKELKQILSKTDRLKHSPETGRRRLIIGAVYVVFLGLFGAVAGILLFREFNTGSVPDYWLLARQAIFSVAFAVTAGFFLRWLNNWAQQLADEELRQKQFEIDLDRASWIVEMALEWKAEKGEEIPEHLLARLSSNLFGQATSSESSMTASDALASAILGTAAKAKVTVPGAEIEIDRSGLKKLVKSNLSKDC
jgi:hypothetical protein